MPVGALAAMRVVADMRARLRYASPNRHEPDSNGDVAQSAHVCLEVQTIAEDHDEPADDGHDCDNQSTENRSPRELVEVEFALWAR